VIEKEAVKILEYECLRIEIHQMWNGKTNVIPDNWSHLKIFRKIPGKHEIKELQTTAILGTAHILREVLMYSLNVCHSRCVVRDSKSNMCVCVRRTQLS
jgi:hypothetical protein